MQSSVEFPKVGAADDPSGISTEVLRENEVVLL